MNHLRAADISVQFDRPTPVRLLASTTLRGLLGHVINARHPDFAFLFKPDGEMTQSVPYAFHSLPHAADFSGSFRTRIVTFDREGHCLALFADALNACRGAFFGTSEARIADALCSAIEVPSLASPRRVLPPAIHVHLASPLMLRLGKDKTIVNERSFSLDVLVRAALNRLRTLDTAFGNGGLVLPPLADIVGSSSISSGNLEWVAPRRFSSSQQESLSLGGIVGSVTIDNPSAALIHLLDIIEWTSLGRNITSGCGTIRISPTRDERLSDNEKFAIMMRKIDAYKP